MTTPKNIYAIGRGKALARFSDRISGNDAGLVLVVFCEPLGQPAHDALQKSFAALGYGSDACTFARISDLDPRETFALVEGIDPLCLVASDEEAATLCGLAARQAFPLMRATRLLGRDARAFNRLNDQLGTSRDRQVTWHLLKSLPRA